MRLATLSLLTAILFAGPALAQQDLVITGVVDGPLPGGTPKAIELYVVNDVADLAQYGIGSANNGDGTDGIEFVLTGSASAGDFITIASEVDQFTAFFGVAPTFNGESAAAINGDDAIELFYDANGLAVGDAPATASVVDVFGDLDVDGNGEAWEYLDGWAYRTNGTGPDGSTFAVNNFTYSGVDALDGETTNAAATTPFPIGTYSPTGTGSTDPVVSFTAASASADEGTTATMSVQIDYPDGVTGTGDVVVDVAFNEASSSAAAADFTGPTPAQLTFSTGADESQDVTVALVDGDGFEGSEDAAFTVAISSGTADLGAPSTFTLTIVNTDAGTTSTIAEARALGVGNAVTVEGTVTRARGDFAYIQDATGGLTIRQADDADPLRIAIGDGTVVPGTTLRVEGTLSEFNGLVQINGDDLASYTVTGSTDVPDAQVVTLAELESNGEDYEGELVQVSAVTIDADGATDFEGSSNYDVSDASSSTNAVALRVGGADESELVGVAIPAEAVTVTAIVGQFNRDGLGAGYQLLPIVASDIAAGTAGESGPEADGFALRAANPSRAGAAVTLVAPLADEATLELFDVVGRRVATLVDGPVAGEQTVRLDAALAAGVYVLRLTTDAGSLARTITVVR